MKRNMEINVYKISLFVDIQELYRWIPVNAVEVPLHAVKVLVYVDIFCSLSTH